MPRNREQLPVLKVGLAEQAHLDFIELVEAETPNAEPVKAKKTRSRTQAAAPDESASASTVVNKPGDIHIAQPRQQRQERPAGLVSPRTGKARVFRGKKHVISVSIAPHVLARVDAWAARKGMSRPAAIAFALDLLPE